jgi:hypothetical protein
LKATALTLKKANGQVICLQQQVALSVFSVSAYWAAANRLPTPGNLDPVANPHPRTVRKSVLRLSYDWQQEINSPPKVVMLTYSQYYGMPPTGKLLLYFTPWPGSSVGRAAD